MSNATGQFLPPLPWYKSLSGRRKDFVGLDIGSHAVKLVRLRRSKTWTIAAAASAELRPDAIVEGRIMNFDAVIEAVRSLVTETNSFGLECALSVAGSSVILKRLSLPEMTRQELDESLLWEAEQYIPFDIKDVFVDAVIMEPRAGQGQMDVLMAAAKKDIVNEYFSVAAEAGLKPVAVEPGIINLLNLFKMNYPSYSLRGSPAVVIIDVGANSTNVGILAGGSAAFTRDIGTGSAVLTMELQRHFNIGWEDAERFKKDAEDPDKVNDPDFDHVKDTDKVAERVMGQLITEIQRSLDFYVATSIKADISRIFLTGGGSVNHHLIRELERRMEAPVELFNPVKNLGTNPEEFPKEDGSSWALAIGLAVYGLETENSGLFRLNLGGWRRPIKKPGFFTRPDWLMRFNRAVLRQTPKRPRRLKITQQELIELAEVLSLLVSCGIPILDTLDQLAKGFRKPVAQALLNVRARVAEGKNLASPMEDQGFPPLFCLVVAAGEIGGNLDYVLKEYAATLRRTS